MNCNQESQGRRLIRLLKRRGMTTLEMIQSGGTCSPWKRLAESLQPGEVLVKKKNSRNLFVYRVKTS